MSVCERALYQTLSKSPHSIQAHLDHKARKTEFTNLEYFSTKLNVWESKHKQIKPKAKHKKEKEYEYGNHHANFIYEVEANKDT